MQQKAKLVMDLDAICNFIFAHEDRKVDTIIEETTGADESENFKRVTESKSSDHSQHEAIRFEIVKRLLDANLEVSLDAEGQPIFETVDAVASYNTAFTYGFYKSVPV